MEDSDDYGRFAMFHERHYRFAQAFLEAVLQGQGCSVSLESVASSPWEFRLDLGFGTASNSLGGSPDYASLFVGAAIPLERRRRLNFLFGAHGQALFRDGTSRRGPSWADCALVLKRKPHPAKWGVAANLFASGGAFHQSTTSPFSTLGPLPSRTTPYGEVGGGLSVHTPIGLGGFALRAGIEGAAGREFSNDPNATNWYRFGFTIELSAGSAPTEFPREASVRFISHSLESKLPPLPSSRRKPGPNYPHEDRR